MSRVGMSTFAIALLLPLALQPDAQDEAQDTVEPPLPAAWEGTLAEGLDELEEFAAEGQTERALGVAKRLLAPNRFARWRRELEAEDSRVLAPALDLTDPLLERLGLNGYSEPVRAAVHHAKGCVRLVAEEREAAEEDFGRSLSLAGPGPLRLVAGYDRGTAALLEGEVWRAQIPELGGQPPAPSPGSAHAPPSGAAPFAPPQPGGAEPPDPLEVARGHYERAKEALVERLRADWRDADTRANVELVQRRLRELDEIERQREEQQQEQDQQQQDQEQQEDQQQEDQQGEPQDESGDDQQDPDQEPETEQPPESEGEEPEPEEDEPQEGEEEQQPEEQEGEPQDAEAEPQEVYLTKEEVQRLLERLREHEEEAETVRARLYQQSRRRVERDW